MKKTILTVICSMLLFAGANASSVSSAASIDNPHEDSRALQLQDMLVLFLLPAMQEKLTQVYARYLKETPGIYPYFVQVTDIQRPHGFRSFEFLITLDVVPTVGPHISVGEDRFTYKISSGPSIKLVNYQHLKSPDPQAFPPNYLNLLK
ncbi:DUF3888 domain-containing protein [Paenibacillus oryzisoli]|uniref:DUF3888 domain-containing protein n=1 Tax=Paenibacillus oryzisoli TaxID=1850517 RepID=UPI003D2B34EA